MTRRERLEGEFHNHGGLAMATKLTPNDQMLTEIRDLEKMAAKLLDTVRKLPPGSERHELLKEIGKFRARIAKLRRRGNEGQIKRSVRS
jgi:hypothetical protein